MSIQNIRRDYGIKELNQTELRENPLLQFQDWFDAAIKNEEILDANAMTLATANKEGQPSARIVLLKGFDKKGFAFYTNYNSRKGQELIENPKAALVFFWPNFERQVRIEGKVEKMTYEDSARYFQSRPKESQIGSTASPQSSVIPNRDVLEDNVKSLRKEFQDTDKLPCPAHWGGFRLVPTRIEFWQGRSNRLHDRLRYKMEDGKWKIERLAP